MADAPTVRDLKYIKLDEDDKLLVDNGLMEVDGAFTSAASTLLAQLKFEENKHLLVEAVNKITQSKEL